MSWSSGTNTIKEGDESKNLTLQMLEVKKQGGGTEYFVRKNDVKLGTKSVTQNGTYTAAADGNYGFSQFSVNVRGGNGSADSHGKPTGGDIKPGGAGSAVVGTDPETGNDVVVGVDEDGQLVQTPVPSGIKIITPPTKTEYTAGEAIDYSGIVVALQKKDGSTFTDSKYPNGHIPMQELIFPVTEAEYTGGADGSATSDYQGNLTQPINFGTGDVIVQREYDTYDYFNIEYLVETGNPKSIVWLEDSTIRLYFVSDAPFSGSVHLRDKRKTSSDSDDRIIDSFSGGAYSIHNQTVYYTSKQVVQKTSIKDYGAPAYSAQPNDDDFYTLAFGQFIYGSTQVIPVQWINSYTGAECEDSFMIAVSAAAHTTESSSGTEGSGGGGSF